MNGLGLYTPRRSAVSSLILPLARAIRYAMKGVDITDKKLVHMSPYMRRFYVNWETSSLPLFWLYRQALLQLTKDLQMPPEYSAADRLRYFTLTKKMDKFQRCISFASFKKTKTLLLSQPDALATRELYVPTMTRPFTTSNTPPPDETSATNDDSSDDKLERAWEGSVERETKQLQVALPSILSSTAGQGLLHAPRSNPDYRLSSEHLRIGLCRKLRLPILKKERRCKCGAVIDVHMDHVLQCRSHSKKWLHDRTRDNEFMAMRTLCDLTGLVSTKSSVLLEPTNTVPAYKSARPLDLAVEGSLGTMGIDITITPAPKATDLPEDQPEATAKVHRRKEVLKWCGTSRPIDDSSQPDPEPTLIVVNPPSENQTKKKKKKKTVPGHKVMEGLIQNNIDMMPGTFDPWIAEGPALTWFKFGASRKHFDLDQYDFGKAKGSAAARTMSKRTMEKPHHCGIWSTSNMEWRRRHGTRQFGRTHRDRTPKAWAQTFLSVRHSRCFAQHIQKCMASSNPNI